LQNSLQDETVKRQMLTLIALEECYIQDKVTALPLFLRLFDEAIKPISTIVNDSHELLPAYGAFMVQVNT